MSDKFVPYIRQVLQEMPPKFDPPTDGYLRSLGHDTSKIRPMGLNECLFPPSPKVLAAITAALGMITRYPDAQAPAVGKIISARYGVPIDRIVWGNGSEEIIKGGLDLSCRAGDGVILPIPTFWGYRATLRAAEVDTTFVEIEPNGALDVSKLIAAITPRTKLVFVVTPNNPSGAMLSAADMERVAAEVPADVMLFVDEAYHEFGMHAGGPDIVKILAKRRGPWIIARTFSKAFAMAGMRIGYGLCSDPVVADALRKTTGVFNVPSLAQAAAIAALGDEEHLAMLLDLVARGRDQLAAGLRRLGLSPMASVGNFMSVEVPMNCKLAQKEMFSRGIQINSWSDPGYEHFIRITIGTAEDIEACLAALADVLATVKAAAE